MGRASASPPASGVPFAQLVDGQWVEMQGDLFSDLGWAPFSGRWPRSGICVRGLCSARPMSERLTNGTACSSSPLLLTPTAQLAVNGGPQTPEKRRSGGHGPTLEDQLTDPGLLLPTPRTTSRAGADHPCQSTVNGKRGWDLGPAIGELLPTPTKADGERTSTTYPRGNTTLTGALLPTPAAGNFNDGESLDSVTARRKRELAKGYNGNGGGTPLAVAVAELLPTPTGREGKGPGTSYPGRVRPDGRVRGEGDATLSMAVEALFPTPRPADGISGTPNQRGSSGDKMLAPAVLELPAAMLLPTPSVADGLGGHLTRSGARYSEELLPMLARSASQGTLPEARRSTGSNTRRRSPGGRPSPDDEHPTLFDPPN
jgi:hypothetical protein